MKSIAILLAAGTGTRFGEDKTMTLLRGKPLLSYSLETLSSAQEIGGIIIVASKENKKTLEALIDKYPKVLSVITGGRTRFESSKFGALEAEKWNPELLLFHNAANPLVTREEIEKVLKLAETEGASGVGRKVTSTLRKEQEGVISREKLWAMETPQAIQTKLFLEAMYQVRDPEQITDDLQVVEEKGQKIRLVEASANNQKITTPEDLQLMEKLLPQKRVITSIGQDSHAFDEEGTLRLGGITIEGAPKLKGNSDGDAVLHALCNALSSSMGEGSLSTFSDTMCQEGITDSAKYVEYILEKLQDRGSEIEHLSISIEGKRPKLEVHREAMQESIAQLCNMKKEQIGITCTSGEGLSAFGRGEGLQVFVIATISFETKNKPSSFSE